MIGRYFPSASLLIGFLALFFLLPHPGDSASEETGSEILIPLPQPELSGTLSLEECLAGRRSIRQFNSRALTMDEISQLLWAGQGITSDWGGRTAPSAGALYPIRLYLVVGAVDGLEPGVYLYEPSGHSLREVICGDIRRDLKSAALDQEPVGNAPVSIVITAIPSITEAKYGDRSMRYIDNEAGCVAENIYLECESLGLGTVTIGAFYDDDVAALLGSEVSPRLIMPVGARE